MYQGVFYVHTSNDDDPFIPLLLLHLHIMNDESGVNIYETKCFLASDDMPFPSNTKMLGHESNLWIASVRKTV